MRVDGEVLAAGRVPVSAPLLFTANDCFDIGVCLGAPVSLDYYGDTEGPPTARRQRRRHPRIATNRRSRGRRPSTARHWTTAARMTRAPTAAASWLREIDSVGRWFFISA